MQPAAILRIVVDANTSKATRNMRSLDRQMGDTARTARRASAGVERMNPAFNAMGSAATNAARGMRRLGPGLQFATRVPVYKIAAIGGAIAAIVPPAVALTSALAPLTGLLGAIPGLATAAASALGTIVLGSMGVGDAVKAALDVQKSAATSAADSMKKQRAAAEGVRTAIRGVADARRDLADAQRAVGDAERGLASAQRSAKGAQTDLNQARQQAARDLVDMRLGLRGAVLSEKEARLELSRAIAEQSKAYMDADSSANDMREADLGVQQARLGLKEATVEAGRAQKDYTSAQRQGINGSEQVVSAQEALRDAQRGVADANRGVADAQRGVVKAQRGLLEAAREVRMAQRDQAEGATEASAGVDKLKEAMASLPPAAQTFVRFIVSLRPKLQELRQEAAAGIFPGLTKGIQAAMGNFGMFSKMIGDTGTALGGLAQKAGMMLGSFEWGRDLAVQGERNVQTITRLGNATLSLADGFRHIMMAAGPLVGFLTKSAEKFSEMFSMWAESARQSGKLEAFFGRTITVTKLTVEAMWDFGQALVNVGKIAQRVWGNDLLVGIGRAAERFEAWTESVRGSRDIEQYFTRWRKRWGDIAQAVEGVVHQYRELRRTGSTMAEALTHVFADSLAKLVPIFANKLGEAAPQIAWGFVRGFLASDAWGKLLIGGWLIAKFGGLRAFIALGTLIGGALSKGMAGGMSAGLVGGAAGGAAAGGGLLGSLRSKILPVAKRAGLVGVGIALADSVFSEFSRRAAEKSPDIFKALKAKQGSKPLGFDLFGGLDKLKNTLFSGGGSGFLSFMPDMLHDSEKAARRLAPALEDIANNQKAISWGRAKELRQELGRLDGVSKEAKKQFAGLINGAVNKGKDLRQVESSFSRMRNHSILTVKEMRTVSQDNFERIRDTMGVNSKRGKEAVETNFRLSLRTIKDFKERGVLNTREGMREVARLVKTHSGSSKESMKRNMSAVRQFVGVSMKYAANATGAGMKIMRTMFRKELSLYGLSKEAIKFRVEGKEQSGKNIPSPGDVSFVNKQRGGPINIGAVSGDSVHAKLERGEYVVNRKAVQKVGKKALDRLNFDMAPRFATGGMVRIPGDPNLTGGRDLVNPSVKNLAAHLVRMGNMEVGYAYDPGGGHESSGHNVTGTALDAVPAGNDPGWTRLETAIRWATNRGMTVYYDGQAGSTPLSNHGEGNHAHFELKPGIKGVGGAGGVGQIGKVKVIGGEGSPIGMMMQSGLDRVRKAANQKLQGLTSAASGSGKDSGMPGVPAGNYTGPLDKDFGANNPQQISFNQAAMLAEKAGLPGVTYAQIAIGESTLRPGAVSSDGGYGLWQMTPRVQSAATVAAWERIGSYFNPWNNARMAKVLAGSGTGTSNYYGTGAVTDWNKHYTGPMTGLQEGGMVGFQPGGSVGASAAKKDYARAYPAARKGKWNGGPAAHKARALGNWQSDNAVDVNFPMNTVLKAVTDGKITRTSGSWNGGGGQTDGFNAYLQGKDSQWWYQHMTKLRVRSGQQIRAGGHIGLSGAGNSVPHLHLGRDRGNPEQSLSWPVITDAMLRREGQSPRGNRGGNRNQDDGPKPGTVKGGNIGYVGDSLGVGTKPLLDKMLKKFKLVGKVKGAMTSDWGIDQLKDIKDKKLKQLVFDFGSNDPGAAGLIKNIRRADAMTGNIPLHVFTLNPGLGGGDGRARNVTAKNKAINKLGGDIKVIPWGEKTGDKLHGNYGKRASMASRSIRTLAREAVGRGPKPGQAPLPRSVAKTLNKAPIGKAFGALLKTIRKSPSLKARGKAVRLFLKRIRSMPDALPTNLQKSIESLTTNATLFGERGDRAGELNEELFNEATGDPMLDADKRPITRFGTVGGLNEVQWVQKQLDTLFQLRNKLARGRQIIGDRRKNVAGLLARSVKLLEKTKEQIKEAAKQKKRLDQALSKIKAISGKNKVQKARKIIKDLKGDIPKAMWERLQAAVHAKEKPLDKTKDRLKNQIDSIEGDQKGRVRVRSALKDSIIPGLRTKHGSYGERHEELLSSLAEVQGTGGPLGILKALPTVGDLGGSIFDAQMRLRELGVKPDRVTDSGTSETETQTSETVDMLKELLRTANMRTAVSQAQYGVLYPGRPLPDLTDAGVQKFTDALKGLGVQTFHSGGVVQGPIGAEQMAVVQGGEGVFTREQMAAMGSPNVNITFSGNAKWLEDLIDVRVERSTRRTGRGLNRGLPGRGGGLISG